MKIQQLFASAALLAATLYVAPSANAGMVLTTAGSNAGFGLSTFASNFPSTGYCCGPLGIAFLGNGNVMVTDYPGHVRVMSNTDGQDASNVTPVTTSFDNAIGLTSMGGTIYMSSQLGFIYQMNNDGTIASTLNNTIAGTTGITNDGTNLFADGSGGIYTVSPTTGSATLFRSGGFDGLSVDLGSGILYASASDNHIRGFRLSDAVEVFDSGYISDGPDGVAVGHGSLAGNLYINTVSGVLYQYNLATTALTALTHGGSRGDFVTVDPTNGSLLLTQTDSILRLTAPEGGSFSEAPEPGTVLTMLAGLGVLGLARRRNR